MPADRSSLVRVEHLSKEFVTSATVLDRLRGRKRRVLRAVDDVSIDIHEGEVLALVGETGSGKSTLARCVMKFSEPTRGRVFFAGQDLTEVKGAELRRLRRGMQMVFQNPHASLNPRMRVGTAIAEPLLAHTAMTRREADARVAGLLELVGLPASAAGKYPSKFSGGQRQRISIARALAVQPQLLVADEPVSALDVSVQAQILAVLTAIRKELGLTMLFITHDLSVVRYIADRVAVMYLGRVVEIGAVEDLFQRPKHPYSRALLEAIPSLVPGSRFREIATPRGDIPSAMNLPSGCRFHPRCPIARAGCALEDPPLPMFEQAHAAACWASIDPRMHGSWPPLSAPDATGRSAQARTRR
jgi:oligopeptide/dipeptide ABC transporter ATP-binding protein